MLPEQLKIIEWLSWGATLESACILSDVPVCQALAWLDSHERFRRKVAAYPERVKEQTWDDISHARRAREYQSDA